MIPPMTHTLAVFITILQQFPASADTPWSVATEQMYMIGLRSIPDADLMELSQHILETCRFRPMPAEILELWRSQKVVTPPEYYYDAKCNVFRPVPAPAVQHYLTGGDDN